MKREISGIRGTFMAKIRDYTVGSIPSHMVQLAAPLIVGNVLQQLYNTIDALILGRFAGSAEFAAVGVAGSVMNLFIFMITGACTGISVLFSQFYGAKDLNAFRREHALALRLGVVVSLLFGLFGFAVLPLLLRFIQTPAELIAPVSAYMRIILAFLAATFLYNLYSALLRSIGQAHIALAALGIAVSINLGLDIWFVAKLGLGIAGAAWATAVSQGISAVLCILYLRRAAPELLFRKADCGFDRALFRRTVRLSAVTGLHNSSLYIGKLLVQGAVNTGGTELISAYTATTRIEGFANSFGDSFSAATSVLVGQNLGAKKPERVRTSFFASLAMVIFMGVSCSLILFVSARAAVGFMLGETGTPAYENAVSYIRLVAIFYTLCFTGNTFAGYFDGIGKVSIPFIGATTHITLRVILSWLLVKKMGLPAVALATGLGWILVNTMWALIKYRMEKRTACTQPVNGSDI